MEGENFVSLKGYISRGTLKEVGENNIKLFKGSLTIPINGREQYIKICAWADMAEQIADISKSDFVHIHGYVNESSFDGKCRHCGGHEKRYWTDVVVSNFMVLEEEAS